MTNAHAVTEQASFSKPSTTNSYLVQVSLVDSEDPYINRVLCVSSKLSFKKFHKALQIAFGWSDIHEHSFSVVRFLEDNEAFRVLMVWLSHSTMHGGFPPDPKTPHLD